MKVVTSAKIQERLNEKYKTVDFSFFENMEESEAELSDADVWITYGDDLQAGHVSREIELKWIMVIFAGVDQLPFKPIKEKIFSSQMRGEFIRFRWRNIRFDDTASGKIGKNIIETRRKTYMGSTN